MSGSYPVLLREAARPERIYAGRAEQEDGAVVLVCHCDGRLVRERVTAADVVSARRGALRLRGFPAVELVLRSGRRIDVAALVIGGLSQLLDSLVPLQSTGS